MAYDVKSSRRPYRTDLSDARSPLIEPLLSEWRAGRVGLGIFKPQHDLREIVNAILYINRTGAPWDLLPHDFPSHKTVYDYYAKWQKEGITERIHDALRGQVRKAAGRDEQPTAVILDSQSVKTSANVPEESQGIDAGKKIKGRKRHIATDVLGLILVILITAASVQDTVGGREVIDQVAATQPRVTKAWADTGYKRSVIEQGAKHNIEVDVITKEPNQRGFIPQHKRWAVERTFGWLMHHRRLARDYETLPENSRTMIHWSMIDVMSRRLTGESAPNWRDDSNKTDIAA
jgi:transposase